MGLCALCCRRLDGDWTVDHVIPRAVGGTDRRENLVLAHRRCNGTRGMATLASDVRTRRLVLVEHDASTVRPLAFVLGGGL